MSTIDAALETDVAHAGDVVFLTFPADISLDDLERAKDEVRARIEGRGIEVICLIGVAATVARPGAPQITGAEREALLASWERPHGR